MPPSAAPSPGLEHATDRAAGTRAVLEGVTFAIRDCRDALAATGTRLEHLLAVGGGSRSDYWLRPSPPRWIARCSCPSRAISAAPSGPPAWP